MAHVAAEEPPRKQAANPVLRRATLKVKLLLLPILTFIVFTSYLDRSNIGYAALALKTHLGLNDVGYGAVAGSLFYTYVLFQWPHTMIAKCIGLRYWLSLNVVMWGVATVLITLVTRAWQLVFLRLIVGFAEAASFPLMYAHLDSFLPDREVAFCWSIVIATSQAASILSGPIAAGLIGLPTGIVVAQRWQWLFLMEGFLAVVAGLVTFAGLVDSLDTATALTDEEKAALKEAKAASRADHGHSSKGKAEGRGCAGIVDWKAWFIGVINLFIATPVYAFMFFSPLLIHSLLGPDSSDALVDVLNGFPYVCATFLMVLVGFTIKRSSDRLHHGIIGTMLAAMLAFTFPAVWSRGNTKATFAHLSILYGINAALYIPVDTMPSAYCAESAGSYAVVNSVKSISGVLGPAVFGAVKQAVGGPKAVAVLGIFHLLGLASLLLFFVLIGDVKGACLCRGARTPQLKGQDAKAEQAPESQCEQEMEGHTVAEV